jgi:hypothetical protein
MIRQNKSTGNLAREYGYRSGAEVDATGAPLAADLFLRIAPPKSRIDPGNSIIVTSAGLTQIQVSTAVFFFL